MWPLAIVSCFLLNEKNPNDPTNVLWTSAYFEFSAPAAAHSYYFTN